MADFFQIPDDSWLLTVDPDDFKPPRLQNAVNKAEAEILSYYTNAEGIVELTGYNADKPENSKSYFKNDLKRTIAEVVSHRLSVADEMIPGLTDLSHGDRSWSWDQQTLDPQWPDDWYSMLVKYHDAYTKDTILWAT